MSDSGREERHQRRADEMADATRRTLIGANTGGIGAIILLLSRSDIAANAQFELLSSLMLFFIGLVVSIFSLFLQKRKALKRLQAAKKEKPEPDFDRLLERNWTYDIVSGVFFVTGGIVGLIAFFCSQ